MKYDNRRLQEEIKNDIKKREELTKVKHSDQPIADMSRRSYWQGYIEAKKDDLGLLGLQDKELREIMQDEFELPNGTKATLKVIPIKEVLG